jgi:hypothetical protein
VCGAVATISVCSDEISKYPSLTVAGSSEKDRIEDEKNKYTLFSRIDKRSTGLFNTTFWVRMFVLEQDNMFAHIDMLREDVN